MGILDQLVTLEKEARVSHDAIRGTIAEVAETGSDYSEGTRRLKYTFDEPEIRVNGAWQTPTTEDGSFSHWVTMGASDSKTNKFRPNPAFTSFLKSVGGAFGFDPNKAIGDLDRVAGVLNDLLVGKKAMIETTQEAITGKDGKPAMNKTTNEPYSPRTIHTMTAMESAVKKVAPRGRR